jgi:IS30 family transposase
MGKSKKEKAKELGVHPSTVYRELKRNAKRTKDIVPDMPRITLSGRVYFEKRPSIVLENEDTGTGKWIL